MEKVRTLLNQEYLRRNERNKTYSLRAFARQLGVHHATLSGLMSGKRKLTAKSVLRISKAIGLSSTEIARLTKDTSKEKANSPDVIEFRLLEQDAFAAMSEWYFDAILELARVRGVRLEPSVISKAFGISELKAKLALETLTRLGLLKTTVKGGNPAANVNTTNLLDNEATSAAMRRYQKAILEKSLEALENVPRGRRDHTSTTVAVDSADLPEIKKLIQTFRHELSRFIQRKDTAADDVYQLQVSFFPLSRLRSNP